MPWANRVIQRSDNERLVALVNYRWSVQVIAELFSSRGGKFVTLHRRLGVGRESLRRTLSALIEQKLVQPNPGHGHPMRPEYILTKPGLAIGEPCQRLVGAIQLLEIDALAFQKWSLPIVRSLSLGATRFNNIQVQLPSITSRALSLTMKNLTQAGLVDRSVIGVYPPISVYKLTKAGSSLASLVNTLNRALEREFRGRRLPKPTAHPAPAIG